MAQVSMNAYDADVYITEFKGLMQYGDHIGGDLRYSPDCMNVETTGGVLQPVTPIRGVAVGYDKGSGPDYTPATEGTLMYLRDYTWSSGVVVDLANVYAGQNNYFEDYYPWETGVETASKGHDRYFIAAHGQIYDISVMSDAKETGEYAAKIIEPKTNADKPDGGSFHTDRWSWVTYEKSGTVSWQGQDVPYIHRILLMSNPIDGMYMIEGDKYSKVTTPSKFAWIERYADRVWGCGYDEEDRDKLYYSRPYDATDWTQDNDDPANGGGEIREPTWDKDRFVALKAFGDALIAFTKQRAWKISGSDPSNFIIQEQYGNGCLYPDTIAVMDSYILMLGEDSLVTYDGYKVSPFMRAMTYDIFRKIGYHEFVKPVAARIGNKYILALANEVEDTLKAEYAEDFELDEDNVFVPEDDVSVELNPGKGFIALIFDKEDGTITARQTPQIVSLCRQAPFALTYEEEEGYQDTDAVNKLCPLRFDSWYQQMVSGDATRWVSPWLTFGRNDIKKGGFDLYFTPEVRPRKNITGQLWSVNGVNGWDTPSELVTTETTGPVTFKITIQTEKKAKSKYYTVQPRSAKDLALGKEHKMKRLHFGGSGRRFRLIIETPPGNTIPWRLVGGVHIIAEIDKD